MANYQPFARRTAKKYGIPENVFLSLIGVESSWNPKALSPAGAVGLAQLMPGTARGLGVDPFDWKQNLDGGARYLRAQIDRFGNVRDALRAYNQGPNAIHDPTAGAGYADKILGGNAATQKFPQRAPLAMDYAAPPSAGLNMDPLKIAFADDPEFLSLLSSIPDKTAQKAGMVSPKGSVRPIPRPANPIIKAAQTQLGKPYVFGSGPDTASFDCSDLIQWAYAQAGINLPRTTFDQINVGRDVRGQKLQPGDLIFPTNHHVVMYVGNGKVIAAPHTGTVVQYQPVSRFGKPVAVRRVL